ncbi:MAG: hypothetical protein V1804_01125 [Patescibacteria group bacterium]
MPEELKPNAAPIPKKTLTNFQTVVITVVVFLVLLGSVFLAIYMVKKYRNVAGILKSSTNSQKTATPSSPAVELPAPPAEDLSSEAALPEEPALVPEPTVPAVGTSVIKKPICMLKVTILVKPPKLTMNLPFM